MTGFAPGLDDTGTNNGTTDVFLQGSVLKYLTDGTTKVMSNYIAPGEQVYVDPTPETWPDNGGGGDSAERTTSGYSTQSLSAGDSETGTVLLGKSFRLIQIEVTAACRIELYATAAAQTADADRDFGTDPDVGLGLILDYLAEDVGTYDLSPLVDGANTEDDPTSAIPLTVTSTGGGVVNITFTYIATES